PARLRADRRAVLGSRAPLLFAEAAPLFVAEAKFLPAAAGTGLVGIAPRVLGGHPGHHVGGGAALAQQAGHLLHGRTGVGEEQLQARAEVVVARLAVARADEAILRAATVAERPDAAAP